MSEVSKFLSSQKQTFKLVITRLEAYLSNGIQGLSNTPRKSIGVTTLLATSMDLRLAGGVWSGDLSRGDAIDEHARGDLGLEMEALRSPNGSTYLEVEGLESPSGSVDLEVEGLKSPSGFSSFSLFSKSSYKSRGR